MTTLNWKASSLLILQRIVPIGAAIIGLSVAILLGLIVPEAPLIAVVGPIILVSALLSLKYPPLAITGFVLILLTNTATVLVRFHGMPYILAGFIPLLLVIPSIEYIVFQKQKIVFTSILFWIICFFLAQILGTLVAKDISEAFEILYTFVLEGILIYFLLVNAIRTQKDLNHAILAVLLSAIVLAAFPIYQQITETFDNYYYGYAQVEGRGFSTGETLIGENIQPRLEGAIGEKNYFSQIMLMITMVCLSQVGRSHSSAWRVLAIIATILAAIATVLPFSRGTAVGFCLLLVVGAMLRVIPLWQVAAILLLGIVMLLAFPQYMARLGSLPEGLTYGASGGTGEVEADSATVGRVTEMKAALVLFAKHPLVGVGPGMYQYHSFEVSKELGMKLLLGNRESHSLYLHIAANNGALGIVAMTGVIVLSLRQLLHTRKRWLTENPQLAAIATGLALALLAYLTTGIFLHYSYIRYFWTFIGLIGATIQIGRNLENQGQDT
jgi:putative inorganic carbon (HCO3(-)) transporter